MGKERIRITAVVPLYNVEGYVGEFLESVAAQRPGAYDVDYVFVDDGSTDGTARIVEEWIRERGLAARLVMQDHTGVSQARNNGLAYARGDWITFPDPDDVLDERYFAAVAALIARTAGAPDIVVTNLQRVVDPDPRFSDTHALRFRFVQGSRIVRLRDAPDIFQMSVASAFFPRALLQAARVEFIRGLHASEDALFIARYLLSRPDPRMGLAARALYGYRRRATRDSAVDGYRRDPRSYVDRFEHGYLPLLEEAASRGEVPGWLQSMVLYECQWLLPQQLDPRTYAASLDDETRARTRAALAACLAHVDDERLARYDATALPLESRVLALALTGRQPWSWIGCYADAPRTRGKRNIVRGYAFSPGQDVEALRDGRRLPRGGLKVRTLDYFGQDVLREVSIWTEDAPTSVRINGREHPVIWPRPGEFASQAADRHRRSAIGDRSLALPPPPGAVRVWRYMPSAPMEWLRVFAARRRHDIELARTAVRRSFASRTRGWLIDHDPDDLEQLTRALFEQLSQHAAAQPVHLVATGGRSGGMPRRAIPHGSIGHAREVTFAKFHVSTRSPQESNGWRVLIHRGGIDPVSRVAIDASHVDLVVVESEAAARALASTSRYFDDQIIVLGREVLVVNAEREISLAVERLTVAPRGR